MYVPYRQLANILSLPKLNLFQLAQQLTNLGLETEVFNEGLKFTLLPNRPDLFSFWGIGQEISILLNCHFHWPISQERKEKEGWIKVNIENNQCTEIYLALVKNVKVQISPDWIRDCLEGNNIRSINNLVDISNLVMLETGQPIHIYDYDLLPNKEEITIRNAKEGEKLVIINGSEIILNKKDLVVSSAKKVISLAGISGGQETAINEKTNNILIEVGSFSSQSLKETSKCLNIFTQASQSFQKGTNLFGGKKTLLRTLDLIEQLHSSDLETKITSFEKENLKKERIINISHEFIEKKLGIKITSQEIEQIWKRLQFPFQKREEVIIKNNSQK